MSKPSQEYLSRVEKWILGGLTIQHMNMTFVQKFRARLAYEAYQVWLTDKQIKPSDLMRRIAAREYSMLLKKADEGNEEARQYVDALHIVPGVARTISEISNDVYVLNWLVSRFDTPVQNIEKAKVVDASDWLIREGMKMGNAKAVKSGADIKMQINNNFNEDDDVADKMPHTEINITGDVSIVKSDRVNYTDEEKRKLARKFGLTMNEVQDMIQDENGVWQLPDEAPEEDNTQDVFSETIN